MFDQEQNHLLTKISNQLEKIIQLMGTQNTTISQVAADVTKFVGDYTTLSAAIKAFLASLSSGANGTTLSAADQATLNSLDPVVQAADASAQSLAASIPAASAPTSTAP